MNRSRLPRRHAGLCLLAAALALAAPLAGAQDKPVELRFAHWLPPAHPLAKLGFEPWVKSVEAASKGSIKVVVYPSQQLGKAADHYDMARDGIADMTWANPGYQAGRFPMFAAGELPMLMSAPGPGSAALDAWYRQYAEREMKDVKLCFAHLHLGTWHGKQAITDPAQVQGMKVRSSNGTVSQWVSALGGTNVQVSAPEAREALEKGVADAITFPSTSIISFGIDKVAKFHTDMRLYQSDFAWVMNRAWYDKLGAAQKKVIDEHCSNAWAARVGAAWGDDEDAGMEKFRTMSGHTVVKPTDAQLAAWRKSAEPIYKAWAESAGKAGFDAAAALDGLRGELKARKALY